MPSSAHLSVSGRFSEDRLVDLLTSMGYEGRIVPKHIECPAVMPTGPREVFDDGNVRVDVRTFCITSFEEC